MSNRALLLGAHTAAPPTEYEAGDGWLVANYSLPILWLSLFENSDLVTWPGTLDPSIDYTAVVGSAEVCLARSRERLDVWRRRWPEDLGELAEQWLSFVSAPGTAFMSIWTEDLSDMSGDDSWASMLASYLRGMDGPESSGFHEALAQSYLTVDATRHRLFPIDEAPISVLAAGYSWARRAPWE